MYLQYYQRMVVPLILSVFSFLSFTLQLKYISRKLILRSSIFRDSTSLITYFTIIIYGIFLLLVLYYIVSFPSIPIVAQDLIYCQPLYFKAAKGFLLISAGIILFPQTFTISPTIAIIRLFITYSGRYRQAIQVRWLLTAISSSLLALLKADTITVIWVSIFLVSGLGLRILYLAISFTI